VISDILSFVPATVQGIYGTLVMDAAGRYTYTLNNSLAVVQRLGVGETLQEVFSYAVQDQHGGISTNTLTSLRHRGRPNHRQRKPARPTGHGHP